MALQTKTFTYGGAYNTASRYYRTELTLTEKSIDAENNCSLLEYTLTLYSGNTRISQYRTGARIFLGGKEYVHRDGTDYANQISLEKQSSLILCQGEITVPHHADGTAALSVSFSVYHPTVASYTPGNFTYTGGTIALTPIPKANSVQATDGYIGGVSMVAVGRKRQGTTHALFYEMGSLSGYLTGEGSHSDSEVLLETLWVPFLLPDSFYQAIPAGKTGKCRLTCRTYEGETFVGENQTEFTVMTRKEDCAPTLTAWVLDGNEKTVALTGDANTLVRFASCAECTLTATAQKGATVAKCTIEGEEAQNLTVENAEKDTYHFTVTDSRGYTEERNVSVPLVPYRHLTAYIDTQYSGEGLTLTVKGSCYAGSFGAVDNTLEITCLLPDGSTRTLTPVIDGESYQAQAVLDIDPNGRHTLTVTAADKLMTVEQTVSTHRAMPVFHWGENAFSVNVPASINGVHMASASGETLQLCAPLGLLVCGKGVLGVADENGWQGTAGVTCTIQDGDILLTLPQGTDQVMLLSPGEITIRK